MNNYGLIWSWTESRIKNNVAGTTLAAGGLGCLSTNNVICLYKQTKDSTKSVSLHVVTYIQDTLYKEPIQDLHMHEQHYLCYCLLANNYNSDKAHIYTST